MHATVAESEGTTAVVDRSSSGSDADAPEFVAAWLTVQAHSSLEAVGLTAALSGALARAGIPCNVLAGLYHDHLLVPESEANLAIEVLRGLREDAAGLEGEWIDTVARRGPTGSGRTVGQDEAQA